MAVAAVLPAASEVTMLYGGALASGALAGRLALFGHHFHQGFSAYLSVVLVGVAGNTLGAACGWLIGVRGGHPLLERYGRYAHITPNRIERAERWFDRFGNVAVPLGFATPVVRSFVAIPAGMFEVPFPRFIFSALGGIAAFCVAIAGIGWAAGSSWHTARHDLQYVEFAVAAAAVLFVAFLLVRHRRSINMAGNVDPPR
jgi:membrane protein DedA with SNARE-associated domain